MELDRVAEVRVDRDLCVGSTMCVNIAPRAFALDDDRLSHVVDPHGEPVDTLLEAVEHCPMAAITFEVA